MSAGFDRAAYIGPPDEGRSYAGDARTSARSGSFSAPVQYPDPLNEAVFHGPAGHAVRLVEPHTEAHPVAILTQLLVGFGNLIGRGPHFEAEADSHYTNLFAALVGVSAKGRKGTSWGIVRRLLEPLDQTWTRERVKTGLSSGEGLVWVVRDPVPGENHEGHGEPVEVAHDKRLLVLEPELASTIRVLGREGNTLSAMVRQAWDTGTLSTLTKHNPAKATDAHVSIIGHVTKDELRRYLDRTETGNGFANRFLWICVKRSKVLPEGGQLDRVDLGPIVKALKDAAEHARKLGRRVLTRDPEARELWRTVYGPLSEGRPGLLGAVTSRAEAQVMRLALVYAVLDCSIEIKLEHLRAALALWRYAEDSARFIFGEALGDPLADELLVLIRRPDGITRTEMIQALRRHKSGKDLDRPLSLLIENGLARRIVEKTGGRPAERWVSTCEVCEQSEERGADPAPSSLTSLSSQPVSLAEPEDGAL